MTLGTEMHLKHQRAACIQHLQSTFFGIGINFFGDSMSRKNHHGTGRDLVQFIDKDDAFRLERIDHKLVVHNLVSHVNRGTEFFDGALHHMNGAVYTGAKSSGGRKNHFFHLRPFIKFSNKK